MSSLASGARRRHPQRLLFVVQRYGHEVAGGSEAACRHLASRLAARGHDVHVLTSCATSYVDWSDDFPPGISQLDGVTVHRLAAAEVRDDRFFSPLYARVMAGRRPIPLFLQEEWMRRQGPRLMGYVPWLEANSAGFDAAVFFTYLYNTSFAGLPIASGLTPTLLVPTAHDEPPVYLPIFDLMFRCPDALAFLTEEEAALVARRFKLHRPNTVVGLGIDLDVTGNPADVRQRFDLGDRPYVLFVGRLDPGKGSHELYGHFVAYKERHPGPLTLLVVGEPVKPLDAHPDVVCAGFVDEQTKRDAIAGCLGLIQPSYYESFSLVLAEAWAMRRPALVQGACEVLLGQARRSNGAIPYWGYDEFEAALELLTTDAALRDALGRAGRSYVEHRYDWDTVLDAYEEAIRQTIALHGRVAREATTAPLWSAAGSAAGPAGPAAGPAGPAAEPVGGRG